MNKTMKCIISIVFGLMLIFGASLTASAARSYCAVSLEGGGEKIYFTDKKLYYEVHADSPCKSSKNWVAKYDPDTNTLTLKGYRGGTVYFDFHPKRIEPKIELIYDNYITVTKPSIRFYTGIYVNSGGSFSINAAQGSPSLYINVKPDSVEEDSELSGIYSPGCSKVSVSANTYIEVTNPSIKKTVKHSGVILSLSSEYTLPNGKTVGKRPLLQVMDSADFWVQLHAANSGLQNYKAQGFYGRMRVKTSGEVFINTSEVRGSECVSALVVEKAKDILMKSKERSAVQKKEYMPPDETSYAYREMYNRSNGVYSVRYLPGKSYMLTVDYGENESGASDVVQGKYVVGETVKLKPVYDRRASGLQFSHWQCSDGYKAPRTKEDPYKNGSEFVMPSDDVTLTAIYNAPVTVVTTGEYADRATVSIQGFKKNTCPINKGGSFYFTVSPKPGYTACDSGEIKAVGGSVTIEKREGEVFTCTKNTEDSVTLCVPIKPIDYKIKYAGSPKSFTFTKTGTYRDVPEEFAAYAYGHALNLPQNSDVKCNTAGYRLEGWYKKYDMSTGKYSDGPYRSVPADEMGDVTFFAKWAEDKNAVYPIIHDSDCSAPENGGYTISGISDAAAGRKDIEFTLNPTNGFEVDDTVTPYIGYIRKNGAGYTKITPTKLGKGRYSFDMPEDVNNSVIIYAKDVNDGRSAFKLSAYTVTYDPNGGEISSDFNSYMPQTYTVEDDLNLTPRSNTIRRRGYTFKYWCFDAECTTDPVYYIKRGNIYKDVTLYANWVPTKYTVTVNTDSGRGNVSDYGSVIQSHTNAYADNEITVWAEPKEGCIVRLLYVFGKDSSQSIYPSEGENHSYTFTMPDENVEVYVYFSPYCTVTTSESPLYTIEPIYDPQNLDYSAEKMPKNHTYKFYLRLAPGSCKTEDFAVTANGVPVNFKEDGGFYYVKISEDTAIEVTGIDSEKINTTANVSGNTLTADTEIYSGLDLYEKVGICAVYDENGKLLQTKTDELDTDSGTTVKTHTFDLTGNTSKKLTVKYFVWNDLGTLTPFLPGGECVVSR